jgi:hypothetical protein
VQLSHTISQGLEATRTVLHEAGYDLPFLIHCEPGQAAGAARF